MILCSPAIPTAKQQNTKTTNALVYGFAALTTLKVANISYFILFTLAISIFVPLKCQILTIMLKTFFFLNTVPLKCEIISYRLHVTSQKCDLFLPSVPTTKMNQILWDSFSVVIFYCCYVNNLKCKRKHKFKFNTHTR